MPTQNSTRCVARNREGHTRKNTPKRPSQDYIVKKRLNRLPEWIRDDIRESIKGRANAHRMTAAEKKRVLRAPRQ